MLLEKIVGQESYRYLLENGLVEFFATDALLQRREGLHAPILPGDELAVEHRAVGKRCCCRRDFRKAFGHKILAARPDEALIVAADQLGANPIPFPFDLPVRGRTQSRRLAI